MIDEINEVTGEVGTTGRLAQKRGPELPTYDNPKDELRHLVLQHAAITRQMVAICNQNSDKIAREDGPKYKKGDKIPCAIPFDTAAEMKAVAKTVLDRRAQKLERAMMRQLKQIPIYNEFLSNIFGLGAVTCAYLVAYVDIAKATKPSSLRRFCGLAVIDGTLERRTKGQKNKYVSKLRTVLFTAFAAMWKTSAQYNKSSKYFEIWKNAKHRIQNSERVQGKQIVTESGRKVSLNGFAHSTGWHKAADILIEDLYVMWRTLEGLPVWPTYQAAKLGYAHGGVPCDGTPRVMTIDEARAIVGIRTEDVVAEAAE